MLSSSAHAKQRRKINGNEAETVKTPTETSTIYAYSTKLSAAETTCANINEILIYVL